ncbi:hypothetical protein WAI453_005047 [Rhynchosporium graminicola]|uniref:Trafficking protein particle complex subunit n=1 Tax=Rhynchosporium graminicola TaxID=2792576 RepID=A0A1E1L4D8_9HELO|nr:related to multiple myeloma protein 2 [Rhynchosporium commune]
MVVYSFYIFDRHTECIYSRLWARQPDRPVSSSGNRPISTSSNTSQANTLVPPISVSSPEPAPNPSINTTIKPDPARARPTRLSAGDDAKLIFGTIFSLRNMVRKLGGPDDSFISYRTGQYKLHYYETPTSIKFVMLTDTQTLNMRNVLHQIYVNLYVEFVVKNPLSPVEHGGGVGVANELFELALDQFVKGVL